jgi:hypothetical protein
MRATKPFAEMFSLMLHRIVHRGRRQAHAGLSRKLAIVLLLSVTRLIAAFAADPPTNHAIATEPPPKPAEPTPAESTPAKPSPVNPAPASAESTIDFARDIRPLLSDACFACHGPDEQHRQADLRLDQSDNHAIEPGDAKASELMARILSDDPDLLMPPPHVGQPLSPAAIELFRRWIDQGARYADHWAFTLPAKPELPKIKNDSWPQTPIDAFVLAKLEQEGILPSAPAERAALLRRLYLDLIGLPPTPDEVNDFIADQSPTAYQQVVERLLDSVHFGERWGRAWLDGARYADSDGFEKDKPRFVWFYRDWVVRALNADMPYNDFIVKQVAGDLLPTPMQDDLVATGFLRNSMINEEGGVDPEQFRMEAMFDRVDAIGKSVLGLTIQCAQCHSHKYDPISHEDYYALFAFINNCDEACITVYTPEEQQQRESTLAAVDAVFREYFDQSNDWLARLSKWEVQAKEAHVSQWMPVEIDFIAETIGGQKFLRQDDGSYLAAGYAPTKSGPTGEMIVESLDKITAIRIEMLCDPNLPHGGTGRSVDGTWALSEVELSIVKQDESGKEVWEKLPWASAAATVQLPKTPLGPQYFDKSKTERSLGPVEMAIDGDAATAWHGDRGTGRRNDPQTAMFVLAEPLQTAQGPSHEKPDEPIRLRIKLSQMHGGWNSDDNQTHNLGRFRVSVTSSDQPAIEPLPPRVMQAIDVPLHERNKDENRAVASAYFASQSDLQSYAERIEAAWQGHPAGSSQLVLAERQTPRLTHRLERGDFLSPKEVIAPAIPAALRGQAGETGDQVADKTADPARDRSQPLNRLDFAQWLASDSNPTTARAIVNRIWQEYFGTGLTATSDDLGLQGEPPTHPELLDYLSFDLMNNGWNLKRLHRQIVLSSTYQQDASSTPERLQIDPHNRLLARGPRFRVTAEMVRDIALAASGLLNKSVGGPHVYPPAPEFLFVPPASYGPKTWASSGDGEQFRRALYTFRFRSVPYPVLQTFDAPNGDVSCVRRSLSNTPLQALATLNEPMFLDCARELARQALALDDDTAAIDFVFVSCTSRSPDPAERAVLQELLDQQRQRFSTEPEIAEQLIGANADIPTSSSEAIKQHAAWTMLCRVVLNLDEAITKP